MAYALDLRLKALELLDTGHNVEDPSGLLSIGTATLWRWLRGLASLKWRVFWLFRSSSHILWGLYSYKRNAA